MLGLNISKNCFAGYRIRTRSTSFDFVLFSKFWVSSSAIEYCRRQPAWAEGGKGRGPAASDCVMGGRGRERRLRVQKAKVKDDSCAHGRICQKTPAVSRDH